MTPDELLGALEPSIYAPTYVYGRYRGWRWLAKRFGVSERRLGPRPIIGNWFSRYEKDGKTLFVCSFETYALVKEKLKK